MVVKNIKVQAPIAENMSLIGDLYEIQKNELKIAANILFNAFSEDPGWKEIFNDEDTYRVQFEMLLKFCMKYGNVFSTSGNFEGVMAYLPHDKDVNLWRIIRSGGFFLSMKLSSAAKKLAPIYKLIEEGKKNLNIGSYIHLLLIGTSQEFQGKGFGGKLLRAIIEKAEIERKAMYLETQNEKNVSLYEKYGFYVIKKINLPAPINSSMWLMVRDAK